MINYLYALVETEASLAACALGLDAAMGVFHVDQPNRASLSCDLMEPVRPLVDSYLLDRITKQPLRREWFFEQHNGNARLMASLTEKLSETTLTWARAVAPVAEWVAQTLWNARKTKGSEQLVPTRLTQRRRTEGRGRTFIPNTKQAPGPEKLCRSCGVLLKAGQKLCAACSRPLGRIILREGRKLGQLATHSPQAEAWRAETQRKQIAARKAWEESAERALISEELYLREIRPRLAGFTNSAIASALNVSKPYAAEIRKGRRRPHPRHWRPLAELAGFTPRVVGGGGL
jgi:hypothetical protein